MLTEHKEVSLSIHGAQSVRLEKGTIEFKNYFKQIPVPFEIYADFECMKVLTQKKYQDHIPSSFAYKLVCVDDKFSKPIVVFRSENATSEFIKAILKEYEYCKKVVKKHFCKHLIMSEEEEEQFQSSNTCCNSLMITMNKLEIIVIAGKFRGSTHWSCNINIQLTKKVPVIFHNLRGYDSHLIFCELNKFDVKIDVIPNRLEKYMAFF